jgi:hypothetical protein
VRVYEGSHVLDAGALAYTKGTDVHFAPGTYDPHGSRGQELLGHELTHVVQQAQGRVQANTQAKGLDINDDHGLESEADDLGARAARGEQARAGDRVSPQAGGGGGVQRYAFINQVQVTKDNPDLNAGMKKMVKDKVVRNYTDIDELRDHAGKQTDYLGNIKDGTWVRFSPNGINLLGENHTKVTLEQVVPAVGTKSFIYEPFSSDAMPKKSKMKKAYEKENKDRFKRFGVGKVKDKQQFGAESLFPKMGFGMTLAIPYFDGTSSIDELTEASGMYVGQPIQRYLKIAWGHSEDNKKQVKQMRKDGDAVPPMADALATVHETVGPDLGKFITKLKVDGFLGDALKKPGNDALLPPLLQFATAFSDAMVEKAAEDPSSRLTQQERTDLTADPDLDEDEKVDLFSKWRDFSFEDSVTDAAQNGVRYAGMGQAHLDHLVAVGLPANGHAFEMDGADIQAFRTLTTNLEGIAVDQS